MSETTPKAWLCKHCNERVDPTMELCWNCGRDRNGELNPEDFVNQVDVDLSRCSACEYSLKGNSDATRCPECGEPVPWMDCEVCGVRGARAEMLLGCPACRISETGVSFQSEVARLGIAGPDGLCRQCEYDMRLLADALECPECGFRPKRETYETKHAESAGSVVEPDQSAQSQAVTRKLVTILIVLLLGGCFVSTIAEIFNDSGKDGLTAAFMILWIGTVLFLVIDLIVVSIYKPYNNSD